MSAEWQMDGRAYAGVYNIALYVDSDQDYTEYQSRTHLYPRDGDVPLPGAQVSKVVPLYSTTSDGRVLTPGSAKYDAISYENKSLVVLNEAPGVNLPTSSVQSVFRKL